jgi:hypothetical protein
MVVQLSVNVIASKPVDICFEQAFAAALVTMLGGQTMVGLMVSVTQIEKLQVAVLFAISEAV